MMFEKSLLRDTEKIHRTSMQSLFESFENLCEGTVIVDREARIVWINERYATKLGAARQRTPSARKSRRSSPTA